MTGDFFCPQNAEIPQKGENMKHDNCVIVLHPENSAACTKEVTTKPDFYRPTRLEVKTLDRPIWLSFEKKEELI